MLIATKKQLKTWKELHKKSGRTKHGLFLAEGERCVLQLLEHESCNVQHVLCADLELLNQIPRKFHSICIQLESSELHHITDAQNPQALVAVCEIPEFVALDTISKKNGNILYLDRIQDPGNLGTLLRTALWFGFEAVILAKGTADPYQPKVVRSTAGATGALPILMDEDHSLFDKLIANNWTIYMTMLSDKAKPFNTFKPVSKQVIVLGNEANGVAPILASKKVQHIIIPGDNQNKIESLNAAISGGIVMQHFSRK